MTEADLPTRRTFITATDVTRAVAPFAKAQEKKEPPPEGMHVLADESLKGLRLICVGGLVSWAIKTEKHSRTIGYAWPKKHPRSLTAPDAARDIGAAVKGLLRTDPDSVEAYLDHRHTGKTHTAALEALAAASVKEGWTLRKCFEVAIEEKSNPASRERISAAQAADLGVTMRRPCFQAVLDKPAAAVTPEDIETVRDEIVREGRKAGHKGTRPSNKFVTHVRTVMDYCAGHHSASGLRADRPWWQMVKAMFEDGVRDRMPTLEDVVRTLILAEEYLSRPLPGRAIEKEGVRAGTLAGLWWTVLTAQRANAGLSLRTYDIGEDMERPGSGWFLAAWDKDTMKAGQTFVLPIPGRAWSVIDGFRQRNTNSSDEWAFPSETKKGVHASVSGVYRILYRLAGRDRLTKKAAEPKFRKDGTPRRKPARTERRNLLEENDIAWWSLHDVRRTLTAFMKSQKIPGGASAVLAHEVDDKEGLKASATEKQRADFQRQRTARITRLAYGNEAQFIDLKSEAMALWTDAVLDEYERQIGSREATN